MTGPSAASDRTAAGTATGTPPTAAPPAELLGIYLSDHLAGSTGGLELFRRAARASRGSALGAELDQLVDEVAEDRQTLLELARALGVRPQRYKSALTWIAEKVGRLKLNGRLVRRSPLSGVLELEALHMGVVGKASGWRTLRAVAEYDERLDRRRLDQLLDRAIRQAETLERLRVQLAAEVLRPVVR